MKKPLDAYVRVSRVGGRKGDSFISPDVQREKVEAFARARGFEIGEVFVDLDQSGGKLDRPEFEKALARVESGESGGIVVAKIDRFARSLVGALQTIDRIQAAGGEVLSAEGDFDTSTPTGKLVVRMMLTLAEFELERIREQWSTAKRRAVGRGIHVASRTPTGYVKGDDGRLVPDAHAAPVVAALFKRRAAGESLKVLAATLNDAGIIGPYGSPNWTSSAVSKILGNRVYVGEARGGRDERGDPIVNPSAHPAIVTPAEWEAAQSPRPSTTPRGEGSLLAGLLRCSGCGYVMKADKMTDPRSGQRVRIYRCRGEHAAGKCPAKASVMGRVIEPLVAEAVFESGLFTALIVVPDAATADAEALLREVESARADLDSFLDSDLAGVIGADRFRAGVEARQERLDRAESALAAAGGDLEPWADQRGTPENARALWEAVMTTAQKRETLARFLDAVVVARGRAAIEKRSRLFWRGEAPNDLPGRGKRIGLRPIALDEPSLGSRDVKAVRTTFVASDVQAAV